MNDLYSFFRYTLPGVLYLFEVAIAAWILFPDWVGTMTLNNGDPQPQVFNAAVALIGATFTAGALGYLFTVAYRAPALFLIDYSDFISELITKKYLDRSKIVIRRAGGPKCLRKYFRKKNAWIIISALWFERTESSDQIKGAVERTQGLSHLLNSSAAIVTGTFFAALTVGGLLCFYSQYTSYLRIIIVFAGLTTFFVFQLISCLDAKRTLYEFCKQVLTDAFAEEYNEKHKVLSLKTIEKAIKTIRGSKHD